MSVNEQYRIDVPQPAPMDPSFFEKGFRLTIVDFFQENTLYVDIQEQNIIRVEDSFLMNNFKPLFWTVTGPVILSLL